MKVRNIINLLILIACSGVILWESCQPGGESAAQSEYLTELFDPGPKVAENILPTSLSIQGPTTLYVGKSNQYSFTMTPDNVTDSRVEWSVDDSSLASVDSSSGLLSGLKEGTVTLTVSSVLTSNIKASLAVNIYNQPLTQLSLFLKSGAASLIRQMTDYLQFSSNKSDLKRSDLIFETSDPNIISLDSNGYIRAQGIGKASLKASCPQYPSVICPDLVISVTEGDFHPVTSLNVSTPETIYIKQTLDYQVIFNDDASDKTFTYTSASGKVAISEKKITGSRIGDETITITSLSNPTYKVEKKIVIIEVRAKEIIINSSNFQYGKAYKLSYTLKPDVGVLPISYPAVTFSSSDSSIASIDKDGYITGHKKGMVNVKIVWNRDQAISASKAITITSLQSSFFQRLHLIIRKSVGHFSVFCVTGIFGYLVFEDLFFKKKRMWLSAIVCFVYGFALAGGSELLQSITPGRYCVFSDVMIDSGGFLAGILITWLLLFLIRKRRKKEEKAK
ncbi:MAG: VanZ family protein [Bacilli bacterium]|jgi:uncharacterized protein YjdB|nr:VanZ family protein [Bacilli bacterium]